jgi:hypothetical protein
MSLQGLRRKRFWASCFALTLLAWQVVHFCPPAFAWGPYGHQLVNGHATEALPEPLRAFYQANREHLESLSMMPDEWRGGDREEGPRHFIDLDRYGKGPDFDIPHDYQAAVLKHGKSKVDGNGIVPWVIGERFEQLVDAMKQRDAARIVYVSAVLGHYVGDVHVPFHATENYDGQMTQQRGIHARFEEGIVERFVKSADVKPQPAKEISNVVDAAFGWATDSLTFVPDILKADKDAQRAVGNFEYGDLYYDLFGKTASAIAARRVNEAAHNLASLWFTAWVQAGRPELKPVKLKDASPFFIGNKFSRFYHTATCRWLPSPDTRITLTSREQAQREGYRPCPYCRRT